MRVKIFLDKIHNTFKLLTQHAEHMEPTETARKGKEESEVASAVAVGTFADLVERAALRNQRIVITNYGKPRAALVGIDDLERLRELDAA